MESATHRRIVSEERLLAKSMLVVSSVSPLSLSKDLLELPFILSRVNDHAVPILSWALLSDLMLQLCLQLLLVILNLLSSQLVLVSNVVSDDSSRVLLLSWLILRLHVTVHVELASFDRLDVLSRSGLRIRSLLSV